MKKRWLSVLLTFCMMLSMVPATFAADTDVARIGDNTYPTLDEAVLNAVNNDTIELLADATTTAGLNLGAKTVTIQAAAGLEEKPSITLQGKGIYVADGHTLTFKNCDIDMTVSDNPSKSGGTANLISDSTLVFSNSNVTITNDEADAEGESAIYLCKSSIDKRSQLYIQDGSTVTITGFDDNSSSSGIFADFVDDEDWQQSARHEVVVSGGSTLTISQCAWGA